MLLYVIPLLHSTLGSDKNLPSRHMKPKKRKPDPETEGEGISRHPTAKRKPDGTTETPMGSVLSKSISFTRTTYRGYGDSE